jgi:hypothetical protein
VQPAKSDPPSDGGATAVSAAASLGSPASTGLDEPLSGADEESGTVDDASGPEASAGT